MGPVSVVIAEDNLLVRAGIEALLNLEDDVEIAGVCSDYDGLMDEVERRRPDVVITDIRMPPTSTTEGIRAGCAFDEPTPASVLWCCPSSSNRATYRSCSPRAVADAATFSRSELRPPASSSQRFGQWRVVSRSSIRSWWMRSYLREPAPGFAAGSPYST